MKCLLTLDFSSDWTTLHSVCGSVPVEINETKVREFRAQSYTNLVPVLNPSTGAGCFKFVKKYVYGCSGSVDEDAELVNMKAGGTLTVFCAHWCLEHDQKYLWRCLWTPLGLQPFNRGEHHSLELVMMSTWQHVEDTFTFLCLWYHVIFFPLNIAGK